MCACTQVLERALCWGEEHKSELPFAYMVNATIWIIIGAIQGTEGDDIITDVEVRRWMKMAASEKRKNAHGTAAMSITPTKTPVVAHSTAKRLSILESAVAGQLEGEVVQEV